METWGQIRVEAGHNVVERILVNILHVFIPAHDPCEELEAWFVDRKA
jgi:hypothetical protein